MTRARRAGPSPAGDGKEDCKTADLALLPVFRYAAPLRWPQGAVARRSETDAVFAVPFYAEGKFSFPSRKDGPAFVRMRPARCGLPRRQSVPRAANCPALVTRARRAGPSPVGTARKDFRLRMFRLGCPCGAPRRRGRRPGKGGRKAAKSCFPAGRVGRNDQWPAFRLLRDQVAPRKGRASRNSTVTQS